MVDFVAQAQAHKDAMDAIMTSAKAGVEALFKETIANNPDISSIRWNSEPNSYCDEGMLSEGYIFVRSDKNKDIEPDSYGYYGDGLLGLWSDDDQLETYDYNLKKYVAKIPADLPYETELAYQLFTKVRKYKEILGLKGHNIIEVSR